MGTRMRGNEAPMSQQEQERAERLRQLERQREETDRRTRQLLEESQSLRQRLRKAAHG